MRVKMLSLFMVLWGCGQDAPAPGEAVDTADAATPGQPPPPAEEPPAEEPPAEEPPAEEPPAEEPPAEELTPEAVAAACDACRNRCSQAQRTECREVMQALDPTHHFDFAACYLADPCDPDQARRCLEGLACDAELLIGSHCDALARCGMDGRGWLSEEDCRAAPYSEPQQWACLTPDRRTAIGACLQGQQCDDLEVCVRMAACPDGICPPALATRLAVDCYRICRTDAGCYTGNSFGTCYSQCDQAALRLADEHRRSFEACALGEQCAPQCIAQLTCDPAPLVPAVAAWEARCGAQAVVTENLNRFACLGHVLQTAVTACLEAAPCEDIGPCLDVATCGDTPGCLAFLDAR